MKEKNKQKKEMKKMKNLKKEKKIYLLKKFNQNF